MIFKVVVGNPAEGDRYFDRPKLDQRFWDYVDSGSHILVSAPRRIGKTSFLLHLCNQPTPGYRLKYHITESINHPNEYFKHLFKSLLAELEERNLWDKIKTRFKHLDIKSAGPKGIEFRKTEINFFEEFKSLIQEMDLPETLIFVIDEFAETLNNINRDDPDQKNGLGRQLLHQSRELRQDPSLNRKLRWVYSGSIGLENVAEQMGLNQTINDLRSFVMPPLTTTETQALLAQVQRPNTPQFTEEALEHLMQEIDWIIPYYLMAILQSLNEKYYQDTATGEITVAQVDEAIAHMLKQRGYFEYWHTRLRNAFSGPAYTFAKAVLRKAAKGGISRNKVYNLAEEHQLDETYRPMVQVLENDGYIVLVNQKKYQFQSPLLRTWWLQNIIV